MADLIRPELDANGSLKNLGIEIWPIDTGVRSLEPDDTVSVAVFCPESIAETLQRILFTSHERTSVSTGPLLAGVTIEFHSITPLGVDGMLQPLDMQNEVECLLQLDGFHIQTCTPLRLTSPLGKGQGFFDPWYVRNNPNESAFFPKLLKDDACQLQISDGSGVWVDMVYNKNYIGGFTGRLSVDGRCSQSDADKLVMLQYLGAGKCNAFGFGRYYIPELNSMRQVVLPSRKTPLISRALSLPTLRAAHQGMKDSASGADAVDYSEFSEIHDDALEKIGNEEKNATREIGKILQFSKRKKGSADKRKLLVFSACDKLVLRSYAQLLTRIMEAKVGIFQDGAIAFRRITSRKKAALQVSTALRAGKRWGFQVDLKSYFDSVPTDAVLDQLRGLLPLDPLVDRLETWMDFFQAQNIKGLPQGSPLSPVLSNLFLTPVDRDFTRRHGGLYYRYADDIIYLTDTKEEAEEAFIFLQLLLRAWNQELNQDKTLQHCNVQELVFLGYYITPEKVEDGAGKDRSQVSWKPPHLDEISNAKVIYITHLTNKLRTEQGKLVFDGHDGSRHSLPWKAISQIHVIGKTGFGSHFIHQAIRESIPVFFCNATGQRLGRMVPDNWVEPRFYGAQKEFQGDDDLSLESARQIVGSKVYNSAANLAHFGRSVGTCDETLEKIAVADSHESLRGYEGSFGRYYFSHFAQLVEPFEFNGRSYHPPEGEINALLSFGYTLLYNRIAAALSARGMNPRIGFFHVAYGAHDALASDVMESFRFVIDELVIELVQTEFIVPADFNPIERKYGKLYRLNGNGFRKFLRQFEIKLHESRLWDGDRTETVLEAVQASVVNYSAAVKLQQPYIARRRI